VSTLALYGVLQAVDGVALKQAVNAWASAPDAEKAARFTSAEAIRWLEWGLRSYQNFALGLALLLFAAAVVRTAWVPRSIAYLMGLSGLTYLVGPNFEKAAWRTQGEGNSALENKAPFMRLRGFRRTRPCRFLERAGGLPFSASFMLEPMENPTPNSGPQLYEV
jgi:hypothetical protein